MKKFLQPLSPTEELYYLQKLKQGDPEAKDVLVERNLRLVAHIVKKYQSPEDELEDLISIGSIGLLKAVGTFDLEKGKFATYAARCIENELLMFLRSKKKVSKETSYYEPIGTDKEGNEIHLLDILESREVDVFSKICSVEDTKKAYKFIEEKLSKREKMVLILRYGLYNQEPRTQREIASVLGISRSYISRIEKNALEKLREAFGQI